MITASIVIFNTDLIDLRKVLESTLNSFVNIVIVIDNSSENTSQKIIENYNSEKIYYIFGHGNIGYGAAHNIALKHAIKCGSEYHVVLNPDISFEYGTLERIASFMDFHEDVGYLLPNVIYPNGSRQYLCKLLPTPIDILGRKLLPKILTKKRNEKFEMRICGYNKSRNVPILSGCFMFLRMDVIMKTGLFDERFFMYFEDFDLIRRIHQISKTVFYPDVTIIHNHAAEHRINRRLLKISIRSAITYFNKWGWFFDKERKTINTHAFDETNIIRQ